jgi:WhiB family transcriptional regulator, redox-sensing transcriptional regulator
VALAWEQLDDEDDESFALWAAMVAGFDVPSLSDRLAAWRPPWMAGAACRGAPTATFFRDRGAAADEAKQICAGCAVRPECLAYATGHDEVGVWGGTASPAERRALRRAG